MATTSSASIAIPSDVHAIAANVSPRGVDLEDRLDLSLDALIKERRKEHKLLKKQEEAKKQKSEITDKRKTPKQQKQKEKPSASVKNDQKAQRKALVNKNRRLPTPSASTKGKQTQDKTKTSIVAVTAKLREEMQADKSKNSPGRRVISPKAEKKSKQFNAAQQAKKKNAPQQTRKVTSPSSKKSQILKQQPKTQTKASPSVRQVVHSKNSKVKLSVTVTGQAGKKKAQKKNKSKVLLPGKVSQALAKKTSAAKKVVKRAKNRKATAKNTQVVRKVAGQRKKKN